jgi:peroxiredoxin (alkyl hydroperoxide reductase subunit C)
MDELATPLPPGTSAPDFTLPCSPHASVSLEDFRGRRVVLAFYPSDWEPVSREQLALYQEYLPTFEDLRTEVVGISPDGVWSHAAFARGAGIRFPLLSDSHPKGAVARAYGVYLEREGSSSRALFVVDGRGIIRWSRAYPGPVNPGVDGILRVLERSEKSGADTARQTDE